MTKKGFSAVEVVVLMLIAIVASVLTLVPGPKPYHWPEAGDHYKWQGHSVLVIAADPSTNPTTYLVRLEDNKEVRVASFEMIQDVPPEKQ